MLRTTSVDERAHRPHHTTIITLIGLNLMTLTTFVLADATDKAETGRIPVNHL